MKTSTAIALAAAIIMAALGAFLYPVPKETVPRNGVAETTVAIPGAALAEVRVPSAFSAEATSGQTYYNAVCAACHGANAAGQGGVAPPLVHQLYVSSHHGDAAFVAAARNGVRQHHWSFGNMPPLEERLTNAELNAIVQYIRELQRENGIL